MCQCSQRLRRHTFFANILRKNLKFLETGCAYSQGAQVEIFDKKKYHKSRDTVLLRTPQSLRGTN